MQIKLKKIKIDNGFHYHLQISINGVVGNFVLDTGATHTVIDATKKDFFKINKKIVRKNQVSSGIGEDEIVSYQTGKQEFSFNKLTLSFKPVLIDLININQSYQRLNIAPVDGILGCDLLVKLNAKINLPNKILTLKR